MAACITARNDWPCHMTRLNGAGMDLQSVRSVIGEPIEDAVWGATSRLRGSCCTRQGGAPHGGGGQGCLATCTGFSGGLAYVWRSRVLSA